jgi:hypothetical protein
MANRRGVSADDLRGWLAELPEVEERETWGHPTFRVRDRMFATLDAEGTSATVKATLDEQRALLAADPRTYSVPAYVGKHGWVSIALARADRAQLHELAVEAWRMTAPKRTLRAWEDSRPSD